MSGELGHGAGDSWLGGRAASRMPAPGVASGLEPFGPKRLRSRFPGVDQLLGRTKREAIVARGDVHQGLFANRISYPARKIARLIRELTPVFRIVEEQRHQILRGEPVIYLKLVT